MPERPQVLAQLMHDHTVARRVLALLEQEIDRVAQYHTPDGTLLSDAVSFFSTYMGQVHNPLEDLIHGALKRRAPHRGAEMEKIAGEHTEANALLAQFAEAVRDFLAAPDGARFAFCRAGRSLVAFERHHLRREETRFFVYANEYLTPDDWRAIESGAAGLNGALPREPNRFIESDTAKKKIA